MAVHLSTSMVVRRCSVMLALGWCGCAVFTGCDSSSPVAESPTVGRSQEEPSDTSANASHTSEPQLDENAVNEEGLVVLQGEVSQSSSSSGAPSPSSTPQASPPPRMESDIILPSKPEDVVEGTPTLASATSESSDRKLPVQANVTSAAERDQAIAADWPEPQAVLFVSGQQHGYLEPCGCTGLENQKGGLIRRDTLLAELRDRGWNLVPVDVGNQVRRIGRQPEIKFQTTADAFKLMQYEAATLGVDDLKLSAVELIQAASSDELNPSAFISANVSVIDPMFFPAYRIVETGGRKIGITAALAQEYKKEIQSADVEIEDPVGKLKPVVQELKKQGCDFLVLLAHGSLEQSASWAKQVPEFDLVVTAGGFGEPTLNPEKIEGTKTVMVQVGTKGMYGGIVGLFDDPQTPLRYQKIAISSQFKDSERMLEQFAHYQDRLKDAGYKGLGIMPISHPTGRQFVGAEVCGECHTTAFDIWENSPHVHATDSIVAPANDRGGIPRHFDPECISCHATGWNPQNFYPYESGFLDPIKTELLTGSGCENCHGPGKAHVDAEYGDVEVDNDTLLELRQQMVIKLDRARDKCLECHDLDNSPDFHVEGAFDEYWERVKHYGKD